MDLQERANEILKTQQKFVASISVDDAMLTAIEEIRNAKKNARRVITTGMGKAGIIATKMSATLASIGIPSFFVHPAEAAHGDLGRIAPGDLVIVFSHSGNTGEVNRFIAALSSLNNQTNLVITISGNATPGIPSNLVVSYGKIVESCIVEKVPSTSTTLMLIIADILAITAAESLGFTDEWFKARHPGGAIGQSYLEQNEKPDHAKQ